MMPAAQTRVSATGSALPKTTALSHGHWVAVAAIILVGAFWQATHPPSADVSWLIVVGEKMLAGQQLYKEVLELNPPMSVFLYVPAIWFEHLTGLSAEAWVLVMTFGLIAAALVLLAHIMTAGGMADDVPRTVIVASILLAVAPMYVFAEREHIAVTLLLPALALAVGQANGYRPGPLLRITIGLLSGLVVSIKPHFGLAILLPYLYLALRLRSWRILFALENLIASAFVLTYAAVVFVFFRIYLTDVVPLLTDTYRVVRFSPWELLRTNLELQIVLFTMGLTVFLLGKDALKPKIVIPLLATAGLIVAFLEQGKGWVYHLYPAFVVAFLLFGCDPLRKALAAFQPTLRSLLTGVLIVMSFAGASRIVSVMKGRDAFETEIAPYVAAHFNHPRLLSLGRSLGLGHPLTRMVGGIWVGTSALGIVPEAEAFVDDRPGFSAEVRERIQHWVAWERDVLAHDLRVGQPDVILLNRESYPYDRLMAGKSEAARYLANYRVLKSMYGVDILVPATSPALTVSGVTRAD